MATVFFTPNVQPHFYCSGGQFAGDSVREVLNEVFAANPEARRHVFDDQAALRKHIAIFVDGEMLSDRARLSDAVSETSSIHILQAMSGG
jgi:hypothetical protein